MASNTDNIRNTAPLFSTTLTGSIGPSDTTVSLQTVSGLSLTTAVSLTIDGVDANNNPTPANREVVIGVVNTGAGTITSLLRGQDGTSAASHASGAIVQAVAVAVDWNSLGNTFLTQHSQAGAHVGLTNTGGMTTDTFASSGSANVGGNLGVIGSLSIGGQDISSLIPSGIIIPFGGGSAPSGFLLCSGQAVSRTTYAALYAVISTTYGVGDGSSTFNLPNLQGRIPVGKNGGTFSSLGATGGEETHILTTGEMPSHNHAISDPGHSHNFSGSNNSVVTNNRSVRWTDPVDINVGSTNAVGTGISVLNAGSNGAHNNLQPYLVLNYLIKT